MLIDLVSVWPLDFYLILGLGFSSAYPSSWTVVTRKVQ